MGANALHYSTAASTQLNVVLTVAVPHFNVLKIKICVYVFVGEHFWCFLFDTCTHCSPFVIYLSSFRHVKLDHTSDPSENLQRQVIFGGLPLKSGKQAWKLVQIWSLQCDFVLSCIAAMEVWPPVH